MNRPNGPLSCRRFRHASPRDWRQSAIPPDAPTQDPRVKPTCVDCVFPRSSLSRPAGRGPPRVFPYQFPLFPQGADPASQSFPVAWAGRWELRAGAFGRARGGLLCARSIDRADDAMSDGAGRHRAEIKRPSRAAGLGARPAHARRRRPPPAPECLDGGGTRSEAARAFGRGRGRPRDGGWRHPVVPVRPPISVRRDHARSSIQPIPGQPPQHIPAPQRPRDLE